MPSRQTLCVSSALCRIWKSRPCLRELKKNNWLQKLCRIAEAWGIFIKWCAFQRRFFNYRRNDYRGRKRSFTLISKKLPTSSVHTYAFRMNEKTSNLTSIIHTTAQGKTNLIRAGQNNVLSTLRLWAFRLFGLEKRPFGWGVAANTGDVQLIFISSNKKPEEK